MHCNVMFFFNIMMINWFKFAPCLSSAPPLDFSAVLSQAHFFFFFNMRMEPIYLEGSLSTASAGRKIQKKCETGNTIATSVAVKQCNRNASKVPKQLQSHSQCTFFFTLCHINDHKGQ